MSLPQPLHQNNSRLRRFQKNSKQTQKKTYRDNFFFFVRRTLQTENIQKIGNFL